MRRLVLFAAFCMVSGSGGFAQPISAEDELRLLLVSRLQVGGVVLTRKAANDLYNQANVDGRGVSKVGYETAARITAAQLRSAVLMEILRFDLDGDMRVSRAEVETALLPQARRSLNSGGIAVEPTEEQSKTILDGLIAKVMEADSNRDGVIDVPEMLELARIRTAAQRGYAVHSQIPLGLDKDGDGIVSRQEYLAAVEGVLKSFDTDGDGVISEAERQTAMRDLNALRQVQAERQAAEQRRAHLAEAVKSCAQPAVPAGAKVVLVGAYQGAALSSVRIGAGNDVVHVADIDIMEGAEPLYVLAASHGPMVWRLTGQVERVARFVVSSKSGVVGLARERVGHVAKPECLSYFSAPGDQAGKVGLEAATALLGGRRPDVIVGHYSIGRLRLPLGQHRSEPPNEAAAMTEGGKALLKEFLRFNPGGLAVIEPKEVVAVAPVATWDLLPAEAGLMQLIDAGLLEVASYARSIQIGGTRIIGGGTIVGADEATTKVERVPNGLRIRGAMQFPIGLNGAHGVTFLLPHGVPMPKGDRGHSRIVCEESRESADTLKAGDTCR